jgi:hypothetical protein
VVHAEPDIWMHDGDYCDYIVVYVDDLAIASKDPKGITNTLMNTYGVKLKGTGPIGNHLGMSFPRNGCGQLCISPQRFIDKMVDLYK